MMIQDSLERRQDNDNGLGLLAVMALAFVIMYFTVLSLTEPLEEKPTGQDVEVEK